MEYVFRNKVNGYISPKQPSYGSKNHTHSQNDGFPNSTTKGTRSDDETRENLRRAIATHAPVAWAHIKMLGEYDFSDEKLRDASESSP